MPLSNMAVRDIETVIHPYTNLARHREVGPTILNEGRGIYLYDDKGKRYIEAHTPLRFGPGYLPDYELDAPGAKSSRIGTVAGSPYTVADEENTRFLTPARCMASSSTREPATLLS